MTTAVVVRKGNRAAIGSDTMSCQGATKLPSRFKRHGSKIVRWGSSYLAVPGSAAHLRVLESIESKYADRLNLDSTESIFETFRSLQPTLVEEYYLRESEEKDDPDQPYNSCQMNLLIANRTGIYELHSYREVTEYDRFWATGTGWEFALGAMEAVYDNEPDVQRIAVLALEIACEFDNSTGGPVEVHPIDLDAEPAA